MGFPPAHHSTMMAYGGARLDNNLTQEGAMARMSHSEVVKRISKKITGFSTPFGGVNWDAPKQHAADEIRKLLVFLEDRRIFHIVDANSWEIGRGSGSHLTRPEWVTESVNKVREQITECLKSMQFEPETQQSLETMRRACREYLEKSPSTRPARTPLSPGLQKMLSRPIVRFRTAMGIEIAKLCAKYGIDVEEELVPLVKYGIKYAHTKESPREC